MVSSTTISPGETDSWNRFLVTFLGTLVLGASLVFAFVLVIDSYDSGWFGLFGIEGVRDWNARTATASRARDPQFDSAIIGNSHGQLLKPSELSRATGLHFAQLTILGTTSSEQLVVLDFFARHHQRIGALVIVADDVWCTHEAALPAGSPFPFWLYGESRFDYARHLFSLRSVELAFQRVLIGLGKRKRSDPDGYFNYEEQKIRDRHPLITSLKEVPPPPAGKTNDFFPAIEKLEKQIGKLRTDVSLIIVEPPVFYTDVPQPGSAAAIEREACNVALKHIVAARPHSNFIDYRIDNALTRDPHNFVDISHYRAKIARKMEEGIANSILHGDEAMIDF